MSKIADWVKETVSGTPGTGTITLGGAYATKYIRFQDAFLTGDKVIYAIEDGSNKELGIGTLTTGAPWTLARTTVLKTLSGGTYTGSSATAISLTSAAVVGCVGTAEGSGIMVGSGYATNTALQAISTILPSDDTIPQNTEGDQILTLSYTPKFDDSIIQIEGSTYGACAALGIGLALFRDAVANALTATVDFTNATSNTIPVSVYFEEVSGNTTARTYKLRSGPSSAGTIYINGTASNTRRFGGVSCTYLKVTEIRQ